MNKQQLRFKGQTYYTFKQSKRPKQFQQMKLTEVFPPKKKQKTSKSKQKIKRQVVYQQLSDLNKNKQKIYCCLYHQQNGKMTKGITPCLTHVKNGIINPITSLTDQQYNKMQEARLIRNGLLEITGQKINLNQLTVNADKLNLMNHTHYINEIQRKFSLPKRLTHPNVYIQKMLKNQRNKIKTDFIYKKGKAKTQYKDLEYYFKLFAKKTQFKTLQDYEQNMIKFYNQNQIDKQNQQKNINKRLIQQILFSKYNFSKYIQTHNFNKDQIEQFFQFIYNKDAFKITSIKERLQQDIAQIEIDHGYISMKSFGQNFKRIYLQSQEEYRNMFSYKQFRQRLINLRLIFDYWQGSRNKMIFDDKLINWKHNQQKLLKMLHQQQIQKQQLQILVQQRKQLNLFMRTLAQCFYSLTDQKQFGFDVLNDRVTHLIEQNTNSLVCFMQFIQKFKQIFIQEQQLQSVLFKRKSFKITQIVQFLNDNKQLYDQYQQKQIVGWIQKIYEYLYFQKQNTALVFNKQTLRLACKQDIQISFLTFEQFIIFKTNQNDNKLNILKQVSEQVQDILQLIPYLEGQNKKYLIECNYILETLIKIIFRKDFKSFEILYQISFLIQQFGLEASIQDIKICILTSKSLLFGKRFDYYDKIWQSLFSLSQNLQNQKRSFTHKLKQKYYTKIKLTQQLKKQIQKQNKLSFDYKDAFENYQNIKHSLKLDQISKPMKKQVLKNPENNQKTPIQIKINVKVKNSQKQFQDKSQMNTIINSSKINKPQTKVNKNLNEGQIQIKSSIYYKQQFNLPSFNNSFMKSSSISTTISNIQGMGSYLDDLLSSISL